MSYEKQEWIDHIEDSETGEVFQEGTLFTAKRMNHIEDGIYNLDNKIEDKIKSTIVSSIHNSEGIIQKIMDVCKTYTDHFDEIVYGNTYTAWDSTVQQVDGKWELDCSSFQNLLIHGVTFENSRYNGNSENKGNPLFFQGIDSSTYRLANQMAKYAVENGYAFKPNKDFSNIEAGDLVFFSWDDYTLENGYTQEQIDFHNNAFMNIDHVAMFLSKKNDTIYQTIQYEENTPEFFFNVSEKNYMSKAVLVARFPFANVENVPENIIADPTTKKTNKDDSSTYTIGRYKLERKLEAGKLYTICMRALLETEDTYITIQNPNTGTTLYSDWGRIWTEGTKENKFYFLCPEETDEIRISIASNSNATIRVGTIEWCCLYEGYKRDIVKTLQLYPNIYNLSIKDEIIADLDTNKSPIYKVVEYANHYLLNINIPLNTSRTGELYIGEIGKKLGNTCRIPCNLITSDNIPYNAILQISGLSETGEIQIIPYNLSIEYSNIMVTGIMIK